MTTPAQRTKSVRRNAGLLALASFALYAATAAPSVATLFDDSLEFQVVAPTLGIAHPSGYPLYTLLGKLATLLIPVRDAAGRLNLFSALCAAAAVGVLYLVAAKLAGNRAAAAVAVVAFAISPAWWSQATIAEVYALHGLLAALFIYCLLRWEESGGQGGRGEREKGRGGERERGRSDAWLSAAALVFGLGMAHHRMMALLLPAALVFIFWADPALIRQPRRWWRPLGLGLAPLLLYLYLPLRGAQGVGSLDGTYSATPGGTLDWILARGYSVFLTGNPFGVERGASSYLALFLEQMGVLPLVVAVIGLARAWRLSTRRATFLLLATAAQVAFGMAYKVQDIEVFFIPAFMLIALWAALGLAPTFDLARRQAIHAAQPLQLPAWARPIYLAAWLLPLAGIVLFYPALEAVQTWGERDRSRAWGVYDYGQDMLNSAAPGGTVVGLLGETTLVRYGRDVLGQEPDLRVVPADAEAARFAAVEAALAAGGPVYLTRDLPGAAARYSLDAAGPLIAVSRKAAPGPAPAGRGMGAAIVLVDAQSMVRQTHSGTVVRLALTWAATAPVHEELKVSARLLDAGGNVVAADDRTPVHFTYPTTAWVPGEPVSDVYDLTISPATPDGAYGVLLILYRAVDGSEVGRAELPPVSVSPANRWIS